MSEYNKIYYNANREKLLNYGKTKIVCDRCGVEICRNAIYQHQKRKICLLKFQIKILESKMI